MSCKTSNQNSRRPSKNWSPAASSSPTCAPPPRPPKPHWSKHAPSSRSSSAPPRGSSRSPRGGSGEMMCRVRRRETRAGPIRHCSPWPGHSAQNSDSSHRDGRRGGHPWAVYPTARPRAAGGCPAGRLVAPIPCRQRHMGHHRHLSHRLSLRVKVSPCPRPPSQGAMTQQTMPPRLPRLATWPRI
jgi:hypothetical protein